MSKKKKKSTAVVQPSLSPKSYLIQGNARKLPIHECWINPDYQDTGLASIVVSRIHAGGTITWGSFLVDIFCLGLKQTAYQFNVTEAEYEEKVEHLFSMQNNEPVAYVLVHNIIYGAIGYAEDLGFKPWDKDWQITQYILEEDDERVELIELEFGDNRRPKLTPGPYDNVRAIRAQLEKTVGEGNYDYIGPLDGLFDDDDWEDDEEWEDDDEEEFDDYEEVK